MTLKPKIEHCICGNRNVHTIECKQQNRRLRAVARLNHRKEKGNDKKK